jgi:hypothetical protein
MSWLVLAPRSAIRSAASQVFVNRSRFECTTTSAHKEPNHEAVFSIPRGNAGFRRARLLALRAVKVPASVVLVSMASDWWEK